MVELSGKYDSQDLGKIAETAMQRSAMRDGTDLKRYRTTSDGTRSSLLLQRWQ
jgi:hypothetical protein